jgi:hypothetical protein
VLIDLEQVAEGSLEDDWDMLPPKKIKVRRTSQHCRLDRMGGTQQHQTVAAQVVSRLPEAQKDAKRCVRSCHEWLPLLQLHMPATCNGRRLQLGTGFCSS